ncbi:MAG TPA: SUMF1/EgtB/PvdO family nonheme iron enzyme [Gemmatimonadales bacterium]|jgi:ergothioneine biosynthesis protein EgtB
MTATLTAADATLRDRLEAAWRRSDQIFSLLDEKALYERPIALRQPFIFYVGHLPAFAWNQVVRGLLGREGFEPRFDDLFARGIDPVGVDRYEPDSPALWPEPSAVFGYRDRVRESLRNSFDDVAAIQGTDVLAGQGRVWQLVIEHEVMHQETLLYMIQQLPLRLKKKPAAFVPYRFEGGMAQGLVPVKGGEVTLGADFARVPFGWDNEFPAQLRRVGDFDIDRVPVSNGEYAEFLETGGYDNPDFWKSEDWEWKQRINHTHPAFWVRSADGWQYRTLFDEFPLERAAHWPVYVSGAEARAFAKWNGRDLPSEAEFQRAAQGAPWGDPSRANIDFTNWAPIPVGSYADGGSDCGAFDLVGNGWEWTSTVFEPFPGFTPWARTYPGYSADFFDGQHLVILGGSFATDRALARRSFRNWFQPHYPFVFATFRTVARA